MISSPGRGPIRGDLPHKLSSDSITLANFLEGSNSNHPFALENLETNQQEITNSSKLSFRKEHQETVKKTLTN